MADLFFDHNVALDVALRLRRLGHTTRTARQLGLQRAEDDLLLLTAAHNGWVVVTHNADDFYLLHHAWLRWSRAWQVSPQHAGILVLRHPVLASQAIEAIAAFYESASPLANDLFVWHRRTGWARQPAPSS